MIQKNHLFYILFLLSLSITNSWTVTKLSEGNGPIRSIAKLFNGKLVGGRSTGHSIEVWQSTNQGKSWNKIGSVATNQNSEYGDIMFLALPNSHTVFCTFREKIGNTFSIIVCKSNNDGKDWVYDSTVIAGQTLFVGAPWLFLAPNGDMQVYYDSEPLASANGARGSQWIAMQQRSGTTGNWNKVGIIVASRGVNKNSLCRDGMATVINTGGSNLMLVTEGVDDYASGGQYSNVIRAIQSRDGGRTWDYNTRKIIYRSWIDKGSGKRYNAYCPMGIRIGNGPVGVTFCTDEDFGGTPDSSSAPVDRRRCHVKFIRTTNVFENWSNPQMIWKGGSLAYVPGMVEYKSNQVIIAIDHLGGRESYYNFR